MENMILLIKTLILKIIIIINDCNSSQKCNAFMNCLKLIVRHEKLCGYKK
jgi:hypothetical protein